MFSEFCHSKALKIDFSWNLVRSFNLAFSYEYDFFLHQNILKDL